jgi:hypothetical protein
VHPVEALSKIKIKVPTAIHSWLLFCFYCAHKSSVICTVWVVQNTGDIVSEGTVQPFLPLKSLDQDEITSLNGQNTQDIVLGRIFVHFVYFGGTLTALIV